MRFDEIAAEHETLVDFFDIRIVNWQRPLSAYMETLLHAGLQLRRFLEPVPADDSLRDDPRFEDWYRVPLFTVMLWQKPPA